MFTLRVIFDQLRIAFILCYILTICWSLTTPQNQEYKDHPERFKDSLPEDDGEHSPKLKKGRRALGRSASNAGGYIRRVSVCTV